MSKKIMLMSMNLFLRRHMFNSPSIVKLIFKVRLNDSPDGQSYCEWGTIFQRFFLPRYVVGNCKILEIGTGAHAILPIFLKKRFPDVSVVASDILADRIFHARRTSAVNKVNIKFMVADMFGGLDYQFDLIVFNPPAIPSGELKKIGVESRCYPGIGSRRCWSSDGGTDGLQVIRKFLDHAAEYLKPNGKIIITINPIHCGEMTFLKMIHCHGLKVERTHRVFGISNSYVLGTKSD